MKYALSLLTALGFVAGAFVVSPSSAQERTVSKVRPRTTRVTKRIARRVARRVPTAPRVTSIFDDLFRKGKIDICVSKPDKLKQLLDEVKAKVLKLKAQLARCRCRINLKDLTDLIDKLIATYGSGTQQMFFLMGSRQQCEEGGDY